MKKLLQTLLLLPLFVLGACGGGGGSGANGSGPTKPINSRWTLESNTLGIQNGLVLNLSSMQVNKVYNYVDANDNGISFMTIGNPYNGIYRFAVGTGCILVSDDINCTTMTRFAGHYAVSDSNKLTLNTSYRDDWNGSQFIESAIDATEIYR